MRSVFIIDPKKVIRTTITYPASTGRNFDEILRVIDSLQLTDSHKVATPANWRDGDDVVIVPSLQDPAEIAQRFPKGFKAVQALPAPDAAAEQVTRVTQPTIIIVPGWRDSGPGHWQSLWAERMPGACAWCRTTGSRRRAPPGWPRSRSSCWRARARW